MDSTGDLDRLSALPDDLLHLILTFVGDATDVTRTAVLSRRWRRLWIQARHLAFLDTRVIGGTVPCRFAGFVDWVLTRRGGAAMASLDIDMSRSPHAPETRVNAWLRYAARNATRSFRLRLPHRDTAPRTIELPGQARMASIWMDLSRNRLRLPTAAAAAEYEALTELALYGVWFDDEEAAGGGLSLGDFVSSCCPRLRKLVLRPRTLLQLVIRAEALQELHIFSAWDLRKLDVTAPNLRVLTLNFCFDQRFSGDGEHSNQGVVRITSQRLEEITMQNRPRCRRPELLIQDLTSVRRLHGLHLDMHGKYCRDRDASLWLLENCHGVEHVDITLDHLEARHVNAHKLIDLTSEGAEPFANVSSMVVRACNFPGHYLVASMSALLLRCPHLRSLCIQIIESVRKNRSSRKCFCDDHHTCRGHQNIFLEYLKSVKITSFAGADEELDLVCLLFKGSNSINSMTLVAEISRIDYLRRKIQEEEHGRETIDHLLMKIPYTDQGH
ncbi:hypothetical protein ACP70R_013731 [Stipagrostis hirtigluma subsp. patula]